MISKQSMSFLHTQFLTHFVLLKLNVMKTYY